MQLTVKKISWKSDEFSLVKTLFHRSFPPNERFPLWLLLLFSKRKGIDFSAFYDRDQFCGFAYTVTTDKTVFLLYLAVNDKIHSKGYGSGILSCLEKMHPRKPVSVNIEPPDETADNAHQRIRRMKFYQKNGFSDTGCRLHTGDDSFVVLSTSQDFSPEDFYQAIRKMFFGIRRCAITSPDSL